MLCPSCRHENAEDAESCLACGRPLAPAPAPPTQERRQLTILFCDLVGSTDLSTRLDPEELQEVLLRYRRACARAVERHDGRIARFVGDGVLVYFGYPTAHDDDAARAVRAAFEIVANMRDEAAPTGPLKVRIGIETGVVLVGDVGDGAGRESMAAIGEAPNLAARLQALAEPNAVVLGPTTRRLLGPGWVCVPLGEVALKGFDRRIEAFEAVREEPTDEPAAEAPAVDGFATGRRQELGVLLERWRTARRGSGQAVFVIGEPGIGKSWLLRALAASIDPAEGARIACRCVELQRGTALHPFAALPGAEADDDAQDLQPRQARLRRIERLIAALLAAAETRPLLLAIEDLHWADATSLELLDKLVARIDRAPLLLVATARPTPSIALAPGPRLSRLSLGRIENDAAAAMVRKVAAGRRLSERAVAALVRHCDGVPLFIEELTKNLLESGRLKQVGGELDLEASFEAAGVPVTLRGSLMARLDRLGPAKSLAQIAATAGRQVEHRLLAELAGYPEDRLRSELDQLIKSELLRRRGAPPDAVYSFKHALVREAAYESMLMGSRRRRHAQIIELQNRLDPAAFEQRPELAAHHYARSGNVDLAIDYWRIAARRAAERASFAEATAHLEQALDALLTKPDSDARRQVELSVQIELGARYLASRGNAAAEVRVAFARARELAERLGDDEALFGAVRGLHLYHLVRGSLGAAWSLGLELVELAGRFGDARRLIESERPVGLCAFLMGDLAGARRRLERVIELHREAHASQRRLDYGSDPIELALCNLAWAEWFAGAGEAAFARMQEAVGASTPREPHARTFALGLAASLAQCEGRVQEALDYAEQTSALATEQGYPYWIAWGMALKGWASAQGADPATGVAQLQEALDRYAATGAEQMRPYFLGLLTEALIACDRLPEAEAALEEAAAAAERTGVRFYLAELLRRQAELGERLGRGVGFVAERLRLACETAAGQGARKLEKRAASRLLRIADDADEALRLETRLRELSSLGGGPAAKQAPRSPAP